MPGNLRDMFTWMLTWIFIWIFTCQESWTQEEKRKQRKERLSGEFRREKQERPRCESGEEQEDATSQPGEFDQKQQAQSQARQEEK